jgi:hypothetical protein
MRKGDTKKSVMKLKGYRRRSVSNPHSQHLRRHLYRYPQYEDHKQNRMLRRSLWNWMSRRKGPLSNFARNPANLSPSRCWIPRSSKQSRNHSARILYPLYREKS